MSNRVALGEIGGNAYGLRVSKPGFNAINADGTAVSVDNLSFDSLNPISHFPLWRIYDVTVAGGTRDSYDIVTPGTNTTNFGLTLAFPPLGYGFWKVSTSQYRSLFSIFASRSSGYPYGAEAGFEDQGFKFIITTSSLKVENYNTTSESFRICLFKVGE